MIATSTKLVQTLHPEQRRTEEEKSFCVPEMMRERGREREKDITNEDNCIVVKTNTFALKKGRSKNNGQKYRSSSSSQTLRIVFVKKRETESIIT